VTASVCLCYVGDLSSTLERFEFCNRFGMHGERDIETGNCNAPGTFSSRNVTIRGRKIICGHNSINCTWLCCTKRVLVLHSDTCIIYFQYVCQWRYF